MPRFHFRLNRVLDWYRERCKMEENRMRLASAAVVEARDQTVRIGDARRAVESELLGSPALSAPDLIALESYRVRARREELRWRDELARREGALEQQLHALLAARRRVRLLEKLKERRLAEHALTVDRELEELSAESFRATAARALYAEAAAGIAG
jgi:flagellar export protein FliJ